MTPIRIESLWCGRPASLSLTAFAVMLAILCYIGHHGKQPEAVGIHILFPPTLLLTYLSAALLTNKLRATITPQSVHLSITPFPFAPARLIPRTRIAHAFISREAGRLWRAGILTTTNESIDLHSPLPTADAAWHIAAQAASTLAIPAHNHPDIPPPTPNAIRRNWLLATFAAVLFGIYWELYLT